MALAIAAATPDNGAYVLREAGAAIGESFFSEACWALARATSAASSSSIAVVEDDLALVAVVIVKLAPGPVTCVRLPALS